MATARGRLRRDLEFRDVEKQLTVEPRLQTTALPWWQNDPPHAVTQQRQVRVKCLDGIAFQLWPLLRSRPYPILSSSPWPQLCTSVPACSGDLQYKGRARGFSFVGFCQKWRAHSDPASPRWSASDGKGRARSQQWRPASTSTWQSGFGTVLVP